MSEQTSNNAQKKFITDSPKLNFFLGLVLGVAIISTAGFFSLGLAKKSNNNQANNNQNNGEQVAGEQAEQPEIKVDLKIAETDHVLGDKNAPIKIFEFSDFQCPYCARHHETLNKIVADYKGQVAWIFKQFPIQSHPLGLPGALASECAAEQGKFWEMADMIFKNQTTLTTESFAKFAQSLGLDTEKFNTCYKDEKYKEKIAADYNLGIDSGVQGTPSNFVNNQSVPGAVPYEEFKQIIEQLLKK
ncbi:disulfide bond formation protein DsbA [Candidatus Kuenenbacteria bacterium CG10_big_fil_rev_8_21_14_0_10_36_11]|uniref:Disulfide bond formation protein DsbA n=1 Tax=Candidatus Kuenenbacteria bacterium CG10_big_fil_rev_8_21_14_0_10_36_11 TaxID=1974618 RepID=A0A2M6WA29_9BACT|nr:MAG: disulfide bond formation protein DsbA [Candidatus Kuenenbacteria bacterium CG10_big_fil_rev_8_21_14_0_10_36_11]